MKRTDEKFFIYLFCISLGLLSSWGLYNSLVIKVNPKPLVLPLKITLKTNLQELPASRTAEKPVEKGEDKNVKVEELPENNFPIKTDFVASEDKRISEKEIKVEEIPQENPENIQIAKNELPTLEQPSFESQVAIGPEPLEKQGDSSIPPMPGSRPALDFFQLARTEIPYADVLVLGILVNDQGAVEDVIIVVPSSYALDDIGFALGYKQAKWTQLDPPLLPGEKRWLEVRINQKELKEKSGKLP